MDGWQPFLFLFPNSYYSCALLEASVQLHFHGNHLLPILFEPKGWKIFYFLEIDLLWSFHIEIVATTLCQFAQWQLVPDNSSRQWAPRQLVPYVLRYITKPNLTLTTLSRDMICIHLLPAAGCQDHFGGASASVSVSVSAILLIAQYIGDELSLGASCRGWVVRGLVVRGRIVIVTLLHIYKSLVEQTLVFQAVCPKSSVWNY